MWLYSIFENFDADTKVTYYIGDTLISDGTVKEWMKSGLNMWATIDKNNGDSLTIENNKIIIKKKSCL